MCNCIGRPRIVTSNMGVEQMIQALAGGYAGSATVLMEMLAQPHGLMLILGISHKRLYHEHIWDVYATVCGSDLDRFAYHLDMELPCQGCGFMAITGLYISRTNEERRAHIRARQFWTLGSYWGLANPPTTPHYKYPITVDVPA